ncbi:D-alanine--D-alanine ligase [Pseudomonas viridiflava]|uniref:D-alanine--D-alanine ligase n=3 Tax=Pseudomonas viridiflava TaxID=33069 RepID=A0A1Y6JIF1_PSEVI|nr:D-alanine--D-alanine ligase [Pseudomonas viridiflava]VVM77654.1 D-alanine--D-alanine ligase A [Pseudomonas fluorescens]MBV1807387.1 D-alanine--D-alanine ligase [Pseudomonas viridiflava]MBV1815143.1 D-alanine--D-alanine ligase [Pseudomonas viridiflava]MEE4076192.1 D-alanine--D-alanine ligase [Pseudomonas viridiflava]MEE4085188.1 D-alanine--D-alanine ligase [Pseudomonas viridiflava]
MKKSVAIIFGGQSSEHEVSLQSARNVINAIDRESYELTLIGVDKLGNWLRFDESDYLLNAGDPAKISLSTAGKRLALLPGSTEGQFVEVESGEQLSRIDVVFPLIHGAFGEDGSLQGLLRLLAIPFVGPDVLGSAACMDKDVTKRLLRDAGIAVAPFVVLTRGQTILFAEVAGQLGLPMFVKPASQGSSVGVSKVMDEAGFKAALALGFQFDHKLLIEQGIVGREVECAVLGNRDPQVSVCGEVVANDEFYAYDTKYLNGDQARIAIPAELAVDLSDEVRNVALTAYKVLGCAGLSRVDFFVTEARDIIINEVNTIPGFTSISMYPKLWQASGLSYAGLIDRLITLALERADESRLLKTDIFA